MAESSGARLEHGIKFPDLIDVEAVLSSRWVVEAQRRRNLPRIPLVCGGRLKFGGRSIGGHLLDISQAGARLRVDVSQVELGEAALSLPGLESIGIDPVDHDGSGGTVLQRVPLV